MRKPLQALVEQKKIIIRSSIPGLEFDPISQIGEDAIDLRLHPKMRRLRADIATLDIINVNLEECVEEFIIPKGGYPLQPGEVVFGETLEVVKITSSKHIGLVVGRPKIASYGISVQFDQIKFPVDLAWHFPLCIKNNTNKTIMIPAFIRIVQLMFVSYPFGQPYKKEGDHRSRKFPGIDSKEMAVMTGDYHKMQREICLGNGVVNYNYEENDTIVLDEVNKTGPGLGWFGKMAAKLPITAVMDAARILMLLGFVKVIFDSTWPAWAKAGYAVVLLVFVIFEERRKRRE